MNLPLWPIAAYFGAVLLVVGSMLFFSWLLGQRHHEQATGEPYESGIKPTGSARLRFASRFYLVAIFFLIFDLEAVFLFAWAVAAREVGWAGYFEVAIFISILVAALVYLWRLGALDQGRRGTLFVSGNLMPGTQFSPASGTSSRPVLLDKPIGVPKG